MPPQHSASCAQASPSCTQYDDGPHTPEVLQSCEQHSVLPPHGLPSVLQVVLSGVHLPPEQLPPQHWPLSVHAALSAVHWFVWHTPPTQLVEQQSVFALHDEPACEHIVGFTVQLPVESQTPEQQVVPSEHGAPNTPQGLLASTLPPPPFFLPPPQAASNATRHRGSQVRTVI